MLTTQDILPLLKFPRYSRNMGVNRAPVPKHTAASFGASPSRYVERWTTSESLFVFFFSSLPMKRPYSLNWSASTLTTVVWDIFRVVRKPYMKPRVRVVLQKCLDAIFNSIAFAGTWSPLCRYEVVYLEEKRIFTSFKGAIVNIEVVDATVVALLHTFQVPYSGVTVKEFVCTVSAPRSSIHPCSSTSALTVIFQFILNRL